MEESDSDSEAKEVGREKEGMIEGANLARRSKGSSKESNTNV